MADQVRPADADGWVTRKATAIATAARRGASGTARRARPAAPTAIEDTRHRAPPTGGPTYYDGLTSFNKVMVTEKAGWDQMIEQLRLMGRNAEPVMQMDTRKEFENMAAILSSAKELGSGNLPQSSHWFAIASVWVDDLKTYEDGIVLSLLREVGHNADAAKKEMCLKVGALVAMLLGVLVVTCYSVGKLTSLFKGSTSAILATANGRFASVDLTPAGRKDEFGDIFRALSVLIEKLKDRERFESAAQEANERIQSAAIAREAKQEDINATISTGTG